MTDRERAPWPLAAAMWLICWFMCFNTIASLAYGDFALALYAGLLTGACIHAASSFERKYG